MLGHTIVCVDLAILFSIFGEVTVTTVMSSVMNVSSAVRDASFSIKIRFGLRALIFYLMIAIVECC